SLVADVLRLGANNHVGKQNVVATQRDAAHEGHVIVQPRTASDAYAGADHAERPNDDVFVELRSGIDPSVRRDGGGHVAFPIVCPVVGYALARSGLVANRSTKALVNSAWSR